MGRSYIVFGMRQTKPGRPHPEQLKKEVKNGKCNKCS